MSTGALGMLETYGLIAAIEGLDAAVKAANVTLCGFKAGRHGRVGIDHGIFPDGNDVKGQRLLLHSLGPGIDPCDPGVAVAEMVSDQLAV